VRVHARQLDSCVAGEPANANDFALVAMLGLLGSASPPPSGTSWR
jgi:hypothetical protein